MAFSIRAVGLVALSTFYTVNAYGLPSLSISIDGNFTDFSTLKIPRTDRLITRAVSSDPNCPDGWLCDTPTPCSLDCKSVNGICLSFEGVNVCVQKPEKALFCRLNPKTGVLGGCAISGTDEINCCHGQCVLPDTQCCTFPGVKCPESYPTLCAACRQGSTCGTNSCITAASPTLSSTTSGVSASSTRTTTGLSTASSTTSASTTSGMSASSTRTTTGLSTASSTTSASTTSGMSASSTRTTTGLSTTSSTTSASSTTATATTASSSATSSVTSSSPIPTIVPQVDSFSFIGCFVDAWDARNLVAGSSEDSNPNGMTVEKCIALAQSGSWRYAGVEFGSQCFVGNTLHGGVQFPDSDCSMVCAGSPSETCGEAGRIQVYQDSTWSSPTLQELADAVRQYNSTVEEVRAAIADYKNVMDDLEHYLSSVSNVKRLNSQIEEFEMRVRKVDGNLQQGQGNLQAVRTKTDAALTKGRQLDTINQDNPSVPDNIYEQWSGTGQLLQQVSEVRDLLKHNVVELEEAKAANNPKPPIEAVANAKKADVVLTSIGAIGGLAASGGFLFALAVIIKFFDRGGNTGTSPTTTTTTSPASISTLSTATTTSTTMTCTATAATTPVGIITKQGVSLAEFNELVVSLPKDPNAIQLTDSGQPNFLYLGYMDECTTEKLDNNPSVELWTIASGSQPIFALNHGGIPACQL